MKNIVAAPLLFLLFSAVSFTVCVASLGAMAQTARGVRQVVEITDPENGFDDQFGYSVAMSGNTLVVGAPQFAGPTGLAYIFVNSGGTWKGTSRLSPGNSQTILFGTSVAVAESVIAVGTPADKNDSANGVVFVFVKPAGGWKGNLTPTAKLTVPGVINNLLGTSVAISSDGQTIVAGGPNTGGIGGTYIFVEPEGGWVDMTEPTATLAPASGHEVGQSVAMSGDTIVVGENNSLTLASAYVFVKPAGGWVSTSQPNATLTASNENNLDEFAVSVAISGKTVVVGSPFYPNGIGPGAAFMYVEPETGWQDMTQTAELGVPVTKTLELGTAVAVEGNVVLSGAPFDPIGHNNMQGAVFGYAKPAGGWANTSQPNGSVTGHDGQAGDRFGRSMAVSGNNSVIGAPYHGGALQGAVYIFAAQ
jgi:hypothetical protein